MEAELETTAAFPEPPAHVKLKITIEDLHSGNNVTAFVDSFNDDQSTLDNATNQAFNKAYTTLMEGNMGPEDQDQDLQHQKPEESDNLNKSASPDADYMKDNGLDKDTHGKKND